MIYFIKNFEKFLKCMGERLMAGQNDYALVEILNSSKIRKRFEEMLGDNASSFINSVLTAVNSNNKLKQCSSATILSAASTAATLKLPIIPSLGYAYIVPFKVQGNYQAAFQIVSLQCVRDNIAE